MDDFFAKDGEPFCITCPPEAKKVQTLEHDPMVVHVCFKCNKPVMVRGTMCLSHTVEPCCAWSYTNILACTLFCLPQVILMRE